jgi:hypothetical protein
VHNWEDEKPTQWGQMNGFQQWSSLSAIILHVGLSENRLIQIFIELEFLEVYHVGRSMFLTKRPLAPRIQPAPDASPPGET